MSVSESCFRPDHGHVIPRLGCILVALACWTCPLSGQEPPAAEALTPVSTIAVVNRTLTDPARTGIATMRFRGTVIFTSRSGDFCLQENAEGIMIEPSDPALRPALGDLVEVEAPVSFKAADTLDPAFFLKATSARVIRPGPLPEPVQTNLPAALNGGTAGRWVEIEGVVLQAALQNGVVTLHLTDQSGWGVVNVHDWRSGLALQDAWGARLRVRCANVGRGHPALRVSSSDQITVIKPGTASLFDTPLADPAVLLAGGITADRFRLRATVLAQRGDYIYLRSEQGPALRASVLQPFHASAPQHPLELIPPPLPESLSPGDRVELVGSPLVVSPFLQMSWSAFHRLSSGELPPPITTGDRNPAALACDHLTLKGSVLWHNPATAPGTMDQLALDSGGSIVHAEILRAAGVAHPPPILLTIFTLAISSKPQASSSRRKRDPP